MTPSAATKRVEVTQIQRRAMQLEVEGLAPGLLTSHIPEDVLTGIGRPKPKGGKLTQLPAEEATVRALYCLDPARDGAQFGFPAIAFERAMVNASFRFAGQKSTEVRGTFQVIPGPDGYLPIRDREWIMAKHAGRNKNARDALIQIARPLFVTGWRMTLPIEFNPDLISDESLINLLNLAGFHIGIGAFRPEKGGPYGRFEVCGAAQSSAEFGVAARG